MSQTTWVHRAARWAVRPLAATRVTPNHLTTLRLATGIAAAAAFAMGNRAWVIWGGVLFVISAFLDRADGELARVSRKTSPFGHKYDLVSDAASTVLAFAGIGVGLAHGPFGGWAVLMGTVSGAAIGAIYWLGTQMGDDAFPGAGGFDADDALFLIGPVAWLDVLGPLLIAASIGAPLFLAYTLRRYRSQLSR